ncbi:calvin cycle protein CP12-3, chloroplastic [Momordica charantia]|uniref:Calvin cycle protein CP12-3, chloroplastic n=1 Tax=Momordica charantia TaxID=3673 RepID=A0A6J1DXW2_MOMCH|nr:calvin cycle protein CP12-3, chloroplastic [Momordica charantia]
MASIVAPVAALKSCNGFLEKKMPYLKLSDKSQPVRAMGMAKYKYKYKGTQMREKHLTEMIEKKVMEAKEVCEGDETSDECKVAWDLVEELSQAKAHFLHKLQNQDPLEYFCRDNPDLDECQIYQE